ncbi:hypothetical protein JOC34_000542 [Virgibacillus halotolerans]|uniref:hypothetical protein n=1 Tax=Virgibacillus halotolerans TaxID=1071053 RepID=UPI001961FFCF|nr:hypothetical protein [Virgibacillus halotolerans]MBM7598185.1 hypothetical protein [Virgibacillus halotolerans]
MTEKVKVTQKQSDWLDKYKSDKEIDYAIDIQPHKKRPDSPIIDWSASKVARALYDGYKVEPRFEVGDWVVHDSYSKPEKVVRVYPDVVETETLNDRQKRFRHATESEITEEKERRFFAEHGRRPWELKEFDELRNKTNDHRYTVTEEFDQLEVTLEDTYLDRTTLFKSKIKSDFYVVCFVESRLDV